MYYQTKIFKIYYFGNKRKFYKKHIDYKNIYIEYKKITMIKLCFMAICTHI